MKKILTALCLSAVMPLAALAQHEEETENGIVSLAGREGFTIASKKGDFVFKPYLLVQTSANFNWYDDEGLDKAYNQDNVANSGFAIPYAVLGFTGKAFGKVSFNLSLNAAATGAALLQQAWFDVELKNSFLSAWVSLRLLFACLPDYVRRNLDALLAVVADRSGDSALFVECRDTQYRNGIRLRSGSTRSAGR